MSVGQSERETQNRVIALFRDALGYRHLGDWTDRAGNSNIEEGPLSTWLTNRGYSEAQIAMALFAGNDSQGLKYGAIGTPETYFLGWKEDEADDSRFKLDKYLLKLCAQRRLIELMRDFVLFDGGIKKLPRAHQYFGVKAAQSHVRRCQGGIIWHT